MKLKLDVNDHSFKGVACYHCGRGGTFCMTKGRERYVQGEEEVYVKEEVDVL